MQHIPSPELSPWEYDKKELSAPCKGEAKIKSTMHYKAVIFDLFHTLIHLEPSEASGVSTSQILGIDEKRWYTLLFSQAEQRLRGQITDHCEIISDIVTKSGMQIPPELIRLAAESRAGRFINGLKTVRPHVLATLDKLRAQGIKTALVSNADKLEKAGWDESPLNSKFDAVIFSCDVGCFKPDPYIYQIALSALALKPEDALFVGDGGSDELCGARTAGITTVLTTEIISSIWPEKISSRSLYADYVINNIEQILDIARSH